MFSFDHHLRILFFSFLVSLMACNHENPQQSAPDQRPIITVNPSNETVDAEVMAKAAIKFLNSLSPEEKDEAQFDFDTFERQQWHFTSVIERKGSRLGYLKPAQKELLFDVVKTGLSGEGYELIREIMNLEKITFIKEKRTIEEDYRIHDKYYLSIFGDPTSSKPWAWKYEGHHVSLNYTSVDGKISVTPAFIGANPGEVDIEHPDKGKRVLAEYEDTARKLLGSLSESQLKTVLISDEAFPEIVTGVESQAHLDAFEGLKYVEMSTDQKNIFVDLIQLHIGFMRPDLAAQEWKKIETSGLDNFYFAWAGSTQKKEGHYYRIHGPATIIEYDNVQNNANHVHIIWRDTVGDFGRDLLKEHYEMHEH